MTRPNTINELDASMVNGCGNLLLIEGNLRCRRHEISMLATLDTRDEPRRPTVKLRASLLRYVVLTVNTWGTRAISRDTCARSARYGCYTNSRHLIPISLWERGDRPYMTPNPFQHQLS